MMQLPSLSVVLGFRNWGVDRLSSCIRSILGPDENQDIEVIVSDYGSSNGEEVAAAVVAAGGRYVRTEADVWSRSRALNAGIAVASGEFISLTDADMVFSPSTFPALRRRLLRLPHALHLVQCRDLPPGIEPSYFVTADIDWDELETASQLRPRWGMGGLVTARRQQLEAVGCLDERMQTYGGEDIDLAYRLRRAGAPLDWIDVPDVRMFHVWHPSSKVAAAEGEAAKDVEFNRNIVYKDMSVVRNTAGWRHRSPLTVPLVSIVIATRRRERLLAEAIRSCLYQTMQDFEIVVVNDDADPGTERLVREFGDDRIRYVPVEGRVGVARARNIGTTHARAPFVAVHDDDDLMLPWRLERQLAAVTEGFGAVFGSFVNFDEKPDEALGLELIISRHFNEKTAVVTGGAPGHGSWLVRREIMEALGYDESLKAGIDHDFAMRSLRAGVSWVHSEQIAFLRRMHNGQISDVRSTEQATTAEQTMRFLRSGSPERGPLGADGSEGYPSAPVRAGFERLVSPYLPDDLCERMVAVPSGTNIGARKLASLRTADGVDGGLDAYAGVSWEELVSLRQRSIEHYVGIAPATDEPLDVAVAFADLLGESTERAVVRVDQRSGNCESITVGDAVLEMWSVERLRAEVVARGAQGRIAEFATPGGVEALYGTQAIGGKS